MKIFAGLVGGLILAILSSVLVTMVFAVSRGPAAGTITFFVTWFIGVAVAVKAPSAGKAWRRLLIANGVLSFLLPLSGLLFTGSYMAHMDGSGEHAVAAAAGAAIGGGLVSALLGFVGFFLGVVFLVVGLLVGRDKQVVYIERSAATVAE